MSEPVQIDEVKIREELAAGRTMTEVAKENGVARSTIARRVARNGKAPAPTAASKSHSNGVVAGLEALQALLDSRWRILPIDEKVRILLDRPPGRA